MRVLVLAQEQDAAQRASAKLEVNGYEVTACTHAGAPAFPCRGLVDGDRCPLDEGPVDVALLIGGKNGVDTGAADDGARCALRRSVPLAIAGDIDSTRYVEWAAAIRGGMDHLPDVVDEAAATPLGRHTRAARRSLRSVLEHHGVDSSAADARVTRHGDDLHVVLVPNVSVERNVAEMASVRAAGAVRDIDPYPQVIDVTVEPAS